MFAAKKSGVMFWDSKWTPMLASDVEAQRLQAIDAQKEQRAALEKTANKKKNNKKKKN